MNEEAPYYQVKEDFGEQRYSSSSASSGDSESSIMKEKRKPKQKAKRKINNPYVVTPSGQENRDTYFDVLGSEQQPLGIPISQLLQPAIQPAESITATTFMPEPVDNSHAPLEARTTNPYVVEPSESLIAVQSLRISLTNIDETPVAEGEVSTPEEQLTAL